MPRPVPTRSTLRGQRFTQCPILSSIHRPRLAGGTSGTKLPLCPLRRSGTPLQPLRPRPAILLRRMCPGGPRQFNASCRQALSSKPAWPPRPRRAPEPLPCSEKESDASRFPTPGSDRCTASPSDVACGKRLAAAPAMPFLWPAASPTGAPGLPAPSDSPTVTPNQPERDISWPCPLNAKPVLG